MNYYQIGATAPLASPLRMLGRAAVETYVATEGHKRWLLWGVRKGEKSGQTFVKDGAKEADVADAFGYMSMADTPYGDLSDIAYAAYWDTSLPVVKPVEEFGGTIDVTPDPVPTQALPVAQAREAPGGKKVALGLGLAVLGTLAVSRLKR